MANLIQCPSCKQQYTLQASLAGKQVQCKKCGNAFHVPGPSTPAAPPTYATPPPPTFAAFVAPANPPAQQRPEPGLLERGAALMGYLFLGVIAIAFVQQLTRTGAVGPVSLVLYAFFTLMAVGLLIPRYWHEPLKGLAVGGGLVLFALALMGTDRMLGLSDNNRRRHPQFTMPKPRNYDNYLPENMLRGFDDFAEQDPSFLPQAEPTPEPPPSGQPVTLWNARFSRDRLSATRFTAEYRVDEPQSLDATSYVWVVHDSLEEVEIPVTLDKSGTRGTLQGSVPGTGGLMLTDVVSIGWQSHLLEVRGPADKRIVSNKVTVRLAEAVLGAQLYLDADELRRRSEDRHRQMIEEIRRRPEDRRRQRNGEFGDRNDFTPDLDEIPSLPRPFRRPRVE